MIQRIQSLYLIIAIIASGIAPFTKALEDQFLPKARFETALKELVAY